MVFLMYLYSFCKGYFNSLDPSDGYGYPRGCSRIGFEVETNPRKNGKRTKIDIVVPEPPKPEPVDYMVIMGANPRLSKELRKELKYMREEIKYMREDIKLTIDLFRESGIL